jgi:hypothetical protein
LTGSERISDYDEPPKGGFFIFRGGKGRERRDTVLATPLLSQRAEAHPTNSF